MIGDKGAKDIKIEWEFSAACANVEIAELKSLKYQEIKFFEAPDSLKCGKLKKVSGKMDTTDCTVLENVDAANFYIKPDLSNNPATACMIETNARNI